jgi:hypothetical protein
VVKKVAEGVRGARCRRAQLFGAHAAYKTSHALGGRFQIKHGHDMASYQCSVGLR